MIRSVTAHSRASPDGSHTTWRPRLFTFLEQDGVPWSNNKAESAVKRLVGRRKAMGGAGAVNEKGLRDFLVLSSVYQTPRYRG